MSGFEPIPAIDILGGKCVRLEQGDYRRSTVYADCPTSQAQAFARAGLGRVHVVDLDGARDGAAANAGVIADVVRTLGAEHPGCEVQVGGGVRDLDAITRLLDLGVARVVLGTAAIRDPAFLAAACAAHPHRILLGLDARAGRLAVAGWQDDTGVAAIDFARAAAVHDLAGIIHTDIARDGMLDGADVAGTARMVAAASCPVIASGGIAAVSDLEAVRDAGCAGAIVGKAIYAGMISLAQLAGMRVTQEA